MSTKDKDKSKANKVSKKAGKKAAEEETDILEQGPNLRGPLFWAGLVLLPIILSLVVSIITAPDPQDGGADVVAGVEQSAPDVQGSGAQVNDVEVPMPREPSNFHASFDDVGIDYDNTARGRARAARGYNDASSGEAPGCNFDVWKGLPFSDGMEKRIEALGRPYRILPPGSIVTKDYRPARVNVDLDENNVIIRVWCG